MHFETTRAYGAIAPEPLGCASHSYLLTEESVTDKRTNTHRQLLILIQIILSVLFQYYSFISLESSSWSHF